MIGKYLLNPLFFLPAFQHTKGDISQAHHFVPSLCNKLSRLLRFYDFVVCMPTNKKEMKMHLLALVSLFRVKIVDRGRGKKEKNKKKKMCVVTSYERLLVCCCCISGNLCLCFEVQQKVIYNIKGFNRLVKGSPDRIFFSR